MASYRGVLTGAVATVLLLAALCVYLLYRVSELEDEIDYPTSTTSGSVLSEEDAQGEFVQPIDAITVTTDTVAPTTTTTTTVAPTTTTTISILLGEDIGNWRYDTSEESGAVAYGTEATFSSSSESQPSLWLQCGPGDMGSNAYLLHPWDLNEDVRSLVSVEYRFDTQSEPVSTTAVAHVDSLLGLWDFEPREDATELYVTLRWARATWTDGNGNEQAIYEEGWARFDVTGISGVIKALASYVPGDCP
ncbi:hypothetical protein [Candidatus Spongiisocius sp.]|uniref:hypothetical protein n=1 Tax=Candidatus Spongiisocius sp. TaxID=3101273 RepID=UPI003B58DC50